MKFYIAVDCEGGACGVSEPGKALSDSRNADYALLQITREADAAARGLFDGGATEVIVWDNHNGSLNLDYDLIDPRCDLAIGAFPSRFPGLDDSFAGVILIGYHAMEGTLSATICHTFSSADVHAIRINGDAVGEMAIDGAVAGEIGIPVLFASSDDKGVAEARSIFPWIETVQTKVSYGWNAAISKHPTRTIEEIHGACRKVAARAQGHWPEAKPFYLPGPILLEVQYKRIDRADEATGRDKGWSRVDAFSVKREIQSIRDWF
jgi:D-amino peptidase